MSIIEFISAFGLGAIVAALVQAWLSNRAYISARNFDEKKKAMLVFWMRCINRKLKELTKPQ
jgi:hypothetical protein